MTRPLEKVDHTEDCDAVSDYGVPAEPVRRPCNCGLQAALDERALLMAVEAAARNAETMASKFAGWSRLGFSYALSADERATLREMHKAARDALTALDEWRARQRGTAAPARADA